jgi:MFS family permease
MKSKKLHYGWLITIFASALLAIRALPYYAFGVFIIPLTTEFGWERGALSTALAMTTLIGGCLSLITGALVDRYGPRILLTISGLVSGAGFLLMPYVSSLWQVYLIWGGLLSIGVACCYVPIISTIPRWFSKRIGMATAITLSGFGIGGMFWPPLVRWLISAYDWRRAFLVSGLITMITMIILAQFLKHSPQRAGLRPYGETGDAEDEPRQSHATRGVSFKRAIKSAPFWLLGGSIAAFFFCVQAILAHITPHAEDTGITAIVAAVILSVVAAGSIAGRLFMGFASDRIGARRGLVVSLIPMTLALLSLIFIKEVWTFYIFAGVFGITYGAVAPLQTTLTAELFGLRSLGLILAGITLFGTLGGAIGPPLAGTIFDTTGNYRWALIICVVLSGLAALLSLILLRTKEVLPPATE